MSHFKIMSYKPISYTILRINFQLAKLLSFFHIAHTEMRQRMYDYKYLTQHNALLTYPQILIH